MPRAVAQAGLWVLTLIKPAAISYVIGKDPMLSFPHQERRSALSLVILLTEGLEAQEASWPDVRRMRGCRGFVELVADPFTSLCVGGWVKVIRQPLNRSLK
jgi:hypothetical protein